MTGQYSHHVNSMQQRWTRAMIDQEWDAILVHSGRLLYSFLDDYAYAFRPNPHFLAWLPLTHHPECALLIRPGEKPALWFYQPEDYWHLPPADPEEWWADQFDVRVVADPGAWQREASAWPARLAVIGDAAGLGAGYEPEQLNPPGLLTALHLERTRKTAYELGCLRQATAAAVSGHRAARAAFEAGSSEFDIHLAYLEACRQGDAELPYGNIIALNANGAVLHYQQRLREPPAEIRSFLIDAGAAVHGYAADVTRTHAARPGEFASLIAAMDGLQVELAGAVAPGVDYRELHLRAHRRIAAVLKDAGIIRIAAEDAVASGLSGVFFPHGLGHFIGLQTHDVAGLIDNAGRPSPRPEGHPFLRLTRVLEPGNTLTIEPGLYFIDSLLLRWKADGDAAAVNWNAVDRLKPCGGIRIEDNVVVTEGPPENLTRNAFAAAARAGDTGSG